MSADTDYEKLGTFYLGKLFDHQSASVRADAPLLYDAKDLCTHAVCVGMTGSGKTGLCISLLEEAAIDGVPAICIDPKGDLGNLLLSFPKLRGEDFAPWIDEEEATRKGQSVEERAAETAALWKKGLAEWDQDPKRIAKFRDAVDISIYTPGSSAGRQLTVLRSFSPPAESVMQDADSLRDTIASTASGLLALLGMDIDPLRSREHILISTLLQSAWTKGETLDLAGIIRAVQDPPLDRVGVMELEQFFPKKDRADLAMSLNGILASPGFGGWLEGDSLDIKKLLWTEEGKPRISILSIAHLSESERMFFVTVLLGEVVSWMRAQSGTSSLRALLYMDEVFGFFPPVANPPSKKPMLTLLKQARAYGLGVMLSTQNPVDLDYKGLANTGTWFIGRMQTERDVARVVEGLEGASTASGHSFDRQEMTARIAGLGKRVFLLNNVHESAPVTFKTRWAMSYLRGPLTRDHIRALTPKAQKASPPLLPREAAPTTASVQGTNGKQEEPFAIDADIEQLYTSLPNLAGSSTPYRPTLYAEVELHYVLAAQDIDQWATVHMQVELGEGSKNSPWSEVSLSDKAPNPLSAAPHPGVGFAELPAFAGSAKTFRSWEKGAKSEAYKACTLTLYKCSKLKMSSQLGEDETDFRVRVRDTVRERRNLLLGKLRESYGKKFEKLQAQIDRAEDKLAKEEDQLGQAKTNTMLSAGTTVLGALFGRKVASVGNVSRAGTTVRRAGKIRKESLDVEQAREKLATLRSKLEALESDFQEKLRSAPDLVSADEYPITEKVLRPRKADIEVQRIALLWRQGP